MLDSLPAPLPPVLTGSQEIQVLNIIRRAARTEIMPRFRKLDRAQVTAKARPDDLVTNADTAAEAMITRALQIAFPSALIVGEEAVSKDPSLLEGIADAALAFHIDPIDGTWNFAHGLAVFGVILAVTRYGKPAFGLIYDPVSDDWVIAGEDGPALLKRPMGRGQPLKAAMGKPLEDLRGHIPLHLFNGPRKAGLAATLSGFASTHPLRCSAHEYRMVAQGHTDFILTESLNPWDHAAGVRICQAAGCHVEMLDGGDYSAARHDGHLLVAPDRTTWNRLQKVFAFLVEKPGTREETARS